MKEGRSQQSLPIWEWKQYTTSVKSWRSSVGHCEPWLVRSVVATILTTITLLSETCSWAQIPSNLLYVKLCLALLNFSYSQLFLKPTSSFTCFWVHPIHACWRSISKVTCSLYETRWRVNQCMNTFVLCLPKGSRALKRWRDQYPKGPSWSHFCFLTLWLWLLWFCIKYHRIFSLREFLHAALTEARVVSTTIQAALTGAVKMFLLIHQRSCTEGRTPQEQRL